MPDDEILPCVSFPRGVRKCLLLDILSSRLAEIVAMGKYIEAKRAALSFFSSVFEPIAGVFCFSPLRKSGEGINTKMEMRHGEMIRLISWKVSEDRNCLPLNKHKSHLWLLSDARNFGGKALENFIQMPRHL